MTEKHLKEREQLQFYNRYMKIFKAGLILLILFFCTKPIYAQDPVFSQFYNAKVYLNPALMGDEEDFSAQLSHRSQWRSLVFPYNTTQFSFMAPLYRDKHLRPEGHIGGLGFSAFSDEAGEGKIVRVLVDEHRFARPPELRRSVEVIPSEGRPPCLVELCDDLREAPLPAGTAAQVNASAHSQAAKPASGAPSGPRHTGATTGTRPGAMFIARPTPLSL